MKNCKKVRKLILMIYEIHNRALYHRVLESLLVYDLNKTRMTTSIKAKLWYGRTNEHYQFVECQS